MGKPLIDMTGQVIGDLFIVGKHEKNYCNGEALWLTCCLKFGNFRILNGSHLRQLKNKACQNCGATQDMIKRRDAIKEDIIGNSVHSKYGLC